MKEIVKNAYRMFKRNNGIYYIQHSETNEQRSLKTNDAQEANRLFNAANQARRAPALNIEMGKTYLRGANPALLTVRSEESGLIDAVSFVPDADRVERFVVRVTKGLLSFYFSDYDYSQDIFDTRFIEPTRENPKNHRHGAKGT